MVLMMAFLKVHLKKNVAKNLLSMNMPIEAISKATGLSLEEIKNISKNL